MNAQNVFGLGLMLGAYDQQVYNSVSPLADASGNAELSKQYERETLLAQRNVYWPRRLPHGPLVRSTVYPNKNTANP